jgi:hypothetical protein
LAGPPKAALVRGSRGALVNRPYSLEHRNWPIGQGWQFAPLQEQAPLLGSVRDTLTLQCSSVEAKLANAPRFLNVPMSDSSRIATMMTTQQAATPKPRLPSARRQVISMAGAFTGGKL